jgi:lambda family phage minor tail protein L
MPIPFSEAQLPAPSALIELFELQLITAIHGASTVYRFHAGINAKGTGDLIWAGSTYLALPIEADGFSYSGNGQLPRPSIKVSNVLGTITALLLTLPMGLEGAKVTRLRTHARYLDAVNFPSNVNPLGTPDPTAEYPREVYFIDRRKSESRDMVEFELAAAFDLAGVRAPKRQVIASICPWVYKSAECSYSGALATCAKSLADCRTHFGNNAQLPFGGFPGAGAYSS